MTSSPLLFVCPSCGSANVAYTCRPECCFQHACQECGTTFVPYTIASGETAAPFDPPSSLPGDTNPTVPCAACGALSVYLLDDGRVACDHCRALLQVRFRHVADEEFEEEKP